MLMDEPIEIDFYPIRPVHNIGSFISIASIGLLLLVGTIFKSFNKPLGPMVLVVIVTDLFFCLLKCSGIVYHHPNAVYCKVMSTITQTLLLVSLTWSVFFAHSLYTVMKSQSLAVLKTNFKNYSIISIFIAGAFGAAMPFTDFVVYSPQANKCWHIITNGRADITFSAFTTLPMTICCGLAIYWYIKTGVQLKHAGHKIDSQYILTLLAYPGIIIICVLPLVILDAMNWFGDFQSSFTRNFLGNVFMLMGALDAFVYGLLPELREYCRKKSTVKVSDEKSSSESLLVSSNKEKEWLSSLQLRQTPNSQKSRATTDSIEERRKMQKANLRDNSIP